MVTCEIWFKPKGACAKRARFHLSYCRTPETLAGIRRAAATHEQNLFSLGLSWNFFFFQWPRMNQISPRALPAVNRTDLTHEFGEKKIFIQSWPVCDTRIWPRENTKERKTHEPLMIHSWTTHKGGPWDTDSFMYSYIPYEESNLRDSSDSDGFLWTP